MLKLSADNLFLPELVLLLFVLLVLFDVVGVPGLGVAWPDALDENGAGVLAGTGANKRRE